MDHRPPSKMTTEERHAQIAEIIGKACVRLKKRSENKPFREFLTGLLREEERPWEPRNKETNEERKEP